jgi:hypothetical protein
LNSRFLHYGHLSSPLKVHFYRFLINHHRLITSIQGCVVFDGTYAAFQDSEHSRPYARTTNTVNKCFLFFCSQFLTNFDCLLLLSIILCSLEKEINETETNDNGKSSKKLEKILIKKIPENLPTSSAKKVRSIIIYFSFHFIWT